MARRSQTWIDWLSPLVVTSCVPSGLKLRKRARSWLGFSSRAYSRPVSGSTRRTAPWAVSAASSLPSGEKAKAAPTPIWGPSRHEPTAHRRSPPPVVASHLPSGLKPTREPPSTRSSFSSLPVWASQILTAVPVWLPVTDPSAVRAYGDVPRIVMRAKRHRLVRTISVQHPTALELRNRDHPAIRAAGNVTDRARHGQLVRGADPQQPRRRVIGLDRPA